jgi:hypothetical protein
MTIKIQEEIDLERKCFNLIRVKKRIRMDTQWAKISSLKNCLILILWPLIILNKRMISRDKEEWVYQR